MTQETTNILIFCAQEQKVTEHVLDIDGNGEIVLTCVCGRFIKLPKGTDAEGLKAYVEAHQASNEGQVTLDAIEAQKAQLIEEMGL